MSFFHHTLETDQVIDQPQTPCSLAPPPALASSLPVVSSHRDTAVAARHCSANHLSQFLVGEAHWARIYYQVVVEIVFGDWGETQISKVFQAAA